MLRKKIPRLEVVAVELLAVLELLYLPLVELTQLVNQLLDLVEDAVPAIKYITEKQCCGSGIRCLFDPWIRDPGWVKSKDPDPG
jgi:hypothetical protein